MKSAAIGALVLALSLSPASASRAEVSTPVQVRYETRGGWSDWHKVQMTFTKGAELNKATRTVNYMAWDNYGTVFFAQNQAAVIKFGSMLSGCTNEFTAACLPRFGNMTGEDQDGTEWEVCTQRYC